MILSKTAIKDYLPSIGLSSVIFLWDIQIGFGSIGVPVYIGINLLLYLTYGIYPSELKRLFLIIISLFLFTYIQTIGIVYLTTPLRSLAAIPIFAIMIVICVKWFVLVRKDLGVFFKVIKVFIIIQLVYQIYQFFLWSFGFYTVSYDHYVLNLPRLSGFFSEPSHVAYGLSSFIYLIIFNFNLALKYLRKTGLICLLFIFLISPSSTLIAIVFLGLLLKFLIFRGTIKSNLYKVIGVISGVALFIFILNSMPDFNERIILSYNYFFSNDEMMAEDNLSVLVLVKGWQMSSASLTHTFLGAGFLNFQFFNDYSEISSLSDLLYELNSMEGASIGYKLVGEYGYLGVFLILYAFIKFLKNCIVKEELNNFENFFLFGLLASFIRGASYFDGVIMITFSIIYINFFTKKIA